MKVCEKCGKPKEREIRMPTFPGYRLQVVAVMCDCDIAEDERLREAEQKAEQRERNKRLRSASLMDDKYKDARFAWYQETAHNRDALRIARAYAKGFDSTKESGLLFYGAVGTGKTYTAACIANELLDGMKSVIITSFVRILQQIRASEEEIMRMVQVVDLLILDDLGAERETDYALEKVYAVIDARVRAGKPMILTTNLEIEFMQNTPDVRLRRIYDRVLGTCTPVKMSGQSFRRLIGTRNAFNSFRNQHEYDFDELKKKVVANG